MSRHAARRHGRGLVMAALICAAALTGAVALPAASPAPTAAASIADAAMDGNTEAVRALLKQGADVNSAQGDGLTALHWAAKKGDAAMASMLIYGGANVRAATRLGGYTPLHLAAEIGSAPVIAALIKGGADVNVLTTTGTTPLMLAAAAGDTGSLAALLDAGADANALETGRGHTALMFAAAADRVEAVKLLLARGADPKLATKTVDLAGLSRAGLDPDGRNLAGNPNGRSGGNNRSAAPAKERVPGVDRQFLLNELVYAQGGMTPLLFAARQGHADVVAALLDGGVNVNQLKEGDRTCPLLIATINGQFDTGRLLLEHGADPDLASENGVTPLYAVVNVQWAPKALYPQPRAYLNQQIGYLDFMKLLLEKGANPNVRLRKKVWYSGYNFDQSGVDEIGATPFWRAAYAGDVEAMKLLVAHGADPNIPTVKPAARPVIGDADTRAVKDVSGLTPVPLGGPSVTPLQAAAGVGFGEGFAGNSHRHAPEGTLAAVKYLVEELHADVNARDHEGNTALHHAAARGDNEMILYLVDHGADVKAVNREGRTTVDMANGPVQRVQPFPDTIALLEKLGAVNNHKCVSC
ncbi:MAG TPA: ankyrin repeat domain-containing protein [Vicinamibacterales bacterium]|nr:ankyrin repeat domain-containing protein [Vicinamibacterales bacterium]